MAAKKNPVQLQVQVTLNPGAFEFLEANAKNNDVNGTLASWVQHWMEQQSRGGIMLSPEDHQYLADLNEGKRYKDSRSLTHAVEKGLKRKEGQYSFQISVDPTHIQPLKEQAAASALTVEELLDGAINMCMTNGWLWQFDPAGGRNIPFTGEMLASTAALIEKHSVDSTDITGLIAEERFIPITREMKTQIHRLAPNSVEFRTADLAALLNELEAARKELAELRVAPRELVAA